MLPTICALQSGRKPRRRRGNHRCDPHPGRECSRYFRDDRGVAKYYTPANEVFLFLYHFWSDGEDKVICRPRRGWRTDVSSPPPSPDFRVHRTNRARRSAMCLKSSAAGHHCLMVCGDLSVIPCSWLRDPRPLSNCARPASDPACPTPQSAAVLTVREVPCA